MAPLISYNYIDPALGNIRGFEKSIEICGTRTRRRRTVSFAVKEDISICNAPTHEGAWCTKEELENFKRENSQSVQALLAGKYRTVADFCERGLENMTKAGSLQARGRKQFATKVVMDEQRKQKDEFVVDDIAIAQKYQKAASQSQVIAVARGQNDAKSVDL